MNFSIVTDTAGAKIGLLGDALRDILVEEINNNFATEEVSIGVAIRCLPESYNRKSFVRYAKQDKYLTIDFCVSVEDYETKYQIEQQLELGIIFLQWLDKGLGNKEFVKDNPNFDGEQFKKRVLELGQKNGWFGDSIDWSQDLD